MRSIFYESKHRILHWKRMLINGPAEWSAALFATGVKSNLLQDGYNPKSKVSAMSLGSTVVITGYADADTASGFGQGVQNQPGCTLVLHENTDKTLPHYRLTAWANGTAEKSLLAIASTTQVEIWEVAAARSISATLRGCVSLDRAQGLAWSPRIDALLAYSKTEMMLIDATQTPVSWRVIDADTSEKHMWTACSWSPCGTHVSLGQKHILHCFSWKDVESVLSEPPRHGQLNASSSTNGFRLDTGTASIGPIAAIAWVSPSICILTTATQLVLEDISHPAPALNSMLSHLQPPPTSSLLLHLETPHRPNIQEQGTTSSSDIIDLTSIRVSSSSTQNSLQILNRAEDTLTSTRQNRKARSHLLIVEHKTGQWGVTSNLELPHLTSPDLLVVQDMRITIGSTLSPRMLAAHLDVSDRQEWTATLSGELELPPTHMCRGIYLAERSPFADVASIEKRQRTSFFHAANGEPQTIYLSKFKAPRRTRPKPIDSVQQELLIPAIASDKTSRSSNEGEDKDLLEQILTKMAAMQTQLNARFDVVDERLQQLTARVEQLERNGGASVN